MARSDWGPSIKDGVVLRTSPSALNTANTDDPYGCPRKYWYGYVKDIREPMGEDAAKGVKIHKEIETYLKNGKKALSAIAMSALKYYPSPGDTNLELELEVAPTECFEVAGIPVLMYIDCVSPYSRYLDTMGAYHEDPSSTVEVIDWKSKGNLDYALTNQQLLDTVQMGMYGAYALRRYDAQHVRLSHVYLQTKGKKRASKSTILADREIIAKKWPKIEALGRDIIDYAKETDVNKIPVNLKTCKRCFYGNICPKDTQHTIEMVFGKALDMSLLPQTPVLDTAAHLANLQAEEAVTPSVTVPEGFAAALAFIQVNDYGTPGLKGDAYKVACAAHGVAPAASGASPGEGKAGAVTFDDPNNVVALAHEVAGHVGTPFVIPAPVLPADAPASKPELAAEPVVGFSDHPAGFGIADPVPAPPVSTPTEAKPVDTHIETSNDNLGRCMAAVDSGKWGPIKKPDVIEGFKELLAKADSTAIAPAACPQTAPAQGVEVYIDCQPSEGTDLAPQVEALAKALCDKYACQDVRLADAQSDLGYGKWKGIITAYFANLTLEPGAYYLNARGNEILEAAAAGFTSAQVTARGIR